MYCKIVKVLFPLLILLVVSSCKEEIPTGSEAGSTILWKGVLTTAPQTPELHWVYYDTQEGVTFIYNGASWDTMSVSGIDAMPITWLGSFDIVPPYAKEMNVYYNSSDRVSYIFTNGDWDTLACSGSDALGLVWKGTLPTPPDSAQTNWIYQNSNDNNTYIYNGSEWDLFSCDGMDGHGIIWQGSHPVAPESPEKNWAYYDNTLLCSYIFNGDKWEVLSKDGAQGAEGAIISWQGVLPSSPTNPQTNWAYQNSNDGCTYIFINGLWNMLSMAGYDGVGIVWMGDRPEQPPKPSTNWAYYNTSDGNSYIFNGHKWDILCSDGKPGKDAKALVWMGVLYKAPENPEYGWAYYNTLFKQTLIYIDGGWDLLGVGGENGSNGKNGEDGEDGESNKDKIHQALAFVNPGDTLLLDYTKLEGFDHFETGFIAYYMLPSSGKVHPYHIVDSTWGEYPSGTNPRISLKIIDPYLAALINYTDKRLLLSLTVQNPSDRQLSPLFFSDGGLQ